MNHYQPGMKMYQVIWERDGERLCTLSTHAADEAGAISIAEAIFADHPELNFPRDGATVRVRVITSPLSANDD